MSRIVRASGTRGLWRGTTPTILRNVPGSGLYFYILSMTKHALNPYIPKDMASLVSGGFSRAAVGFLMMPVSILKVRFEVFPFPLDHKSSQYNYVSLFEAVKCIHRTEGFRGFFVGYGATIMRDAPYAGIYVYFYEKLKRMSNIESNQSTQPSSHLITIKTLGSSFLSGAIATTIIHPFDVIKTRIQLYPSRYTSTIQAFGKIIRREGVKSLFSGFVPRGTRKVVSAMITWTVYEEMLKRL